jgi:hypothetical protein
MHDAKDQRGFVFYDAHNHVFPHGEAAVTGSEVFLAGTSNIGEAGKREETVCDEINWPSSGIKAS